MSTHIYPRCCGRGKLTVFAATPWSTISTRELLARACTAVDTPCAGCLAGAACEGPREHLMFAPGDDVAAEVLS